MSQDVDQFRQQLGLTEYDFKPRDSDMLALADNEHYAELIGGFRGYLCKLLMDDRKDYFQLDKYDSPDGCALKAYVAPLSSFFDSDHIPGLDAVRIIVSKDDRRDEKRRQLISEDFIIHPFLMAQVIYGKQQTVNIEVNTEDNDKSSWPCGANDVPKVVRKIDDSDRKLGPASINVHVGRDYESAITPNDKEHFDRRLIVAQQLKTHMDLFDCGAKIPLKSNPGVIYH